MAIIQQDFENGNSEKVNITHFYKEYKLGSLLTQSNVRKEKGISLGFLFTTLLAIIFTGKSLNRLNQENKLGFKKDTAYRFLNSIHTNWQKFICLLAKTIILKLNPTTSDNRIETLIIDDIIYKRDRSKNVELLSKVYDHNDKRFFKGFRCLTAGYSDGETFIPTCFNLLSSLRKKSRYNEANENIDRRSFGYERREASKNSMPDAAFNLVCVAQQGEISF